MNTDDIVPTIEELQEDGHSLRAAMETNPSVDGHRSITIYLSPEEFKRIGGTEKDLWDLSIKVSNYVNKQISQS